jgi:hypothetical protein
MGLHLQAENAHISKQINKIIRHELVWRNDARSRHDLDARTHKVMSCSLSLYLHSLAQRVVLAMINLVYALTQTFAACSRLNFCCNK